MKRKRTGPRWTNKKLPGKETVRQKLVYLYPGGDMDERLEQYYAKKIRYLWSVFGVGLGLSLLLLVNTLQSKELMENTFLPRREVVYEKELQLQIEGEEMREVSIVVEPRQLSEKESRKLLEEVKAEMPAYILGDNQTLDEVRSALNLVSKVEGTPVTVTWELDSYEVLNLDGTIRQENLKEEGTIVGLTAHLICNEEAEVYQAYAKILPPVLSPEELFSQELQKQLAKLQSESSEEAQKELPQEIQGKRVIWKEKMSWSAVAVLGLTLVCVPLLYVAKDQDLKQCMQERERQMCRDYAQMVSKLVLLMGAGMTIRNAWEQIVRDYQFKRENGKMSLRYAYEEMALACYEMQSGVAEAKAYENFGQRCCVPCYLKLAALLEQNLKKGNRGLTTLLKIEVQEAFSQRKELARNQGEEASTKLLLPMILLLLVVMILILVPAGMSMQM